MSYTNVSLAVARRILELKVGDEILYQRGITIGGEKLGRGKIINIYEARSGDLLFDVGADAPFIESDDVIFQKT